MQNGPQYITVLQLELEIHLYFIIDTHFELMSLLKFENILMFIIPTGFVDQAVSLPSDTLRLNIMIILYRPRPHGQKYGRNR